MKQEAGSDATEDVTMHSNGKVSVNWFNINVPTILSVIAAAWATVTYVNNMDNRITRIEESRVQRTVISDRNFEDINRRLDPLHNLPYRMGIVEAQINNTNARLDKASEQLTSTLDTIRKDISGIGVKLEVLTTRIETSSSDRRSRLGTIPSELVRPQINPQ